MPASRQRVGVPFGYAHAIGHHQPWLHLQKLFHIHTGAQTHFGNLPGGDALHNFRRGGPEQAVQTNQSVGQTQAGQIGRMGSMENNRLHGDFNHRSLHALGRRCAARCTST